VKYEQIAIGDRRTLTKTITEDMVGAFADFTGDYNPVHTDEDYCRSRGLESGSYMDVVLSFLSTLIGMYLPGGGAVWLSQSVDFISPVNINDTVEITCEVVKKSSANALGLGILDMKVRIRNQFNKLVAKGTVKVTVN
jgi:acyl dehydratase